jgi:hypothetical protein
MVMAFDLALDSAGKSMAAKIAMMAITTSSSINVKARFLTPVGDERYGFIFMGQQIGSVFNVKQPSLGRIRFRVFHSPIYHTKRQ